MTIQAQNISDLLQSTLEELGEFKLTNIATNLQKYEAAKRLFRKNRKITSSGTAINTNVLVSYPAVAKFEGLYESREYKTADGLKDTTVPWRHAHSSYVIEKHEITMNSGARRILDLLKVRRMQGYLSLFELWESAFWSKPVDSTDTKTIWGLFMSVVPANGTPGFIGGNPAGFAGGYAGLDSNTYPNWRNWAGNYGVVTQTDLIRKVREAIDKTNFIPVVTDIASYKSGTDCQIFVNYNTMQQIDELGRAQNESIGYDLGYMDGRVTIRGCTVNWVPQIDNTTLYPGNPVIGVNFGELEAHFLSGFDMVESKPRPLDRNPNIHAVDIDTTMNLVNRNRRAHFYLRQV
jgi:uncharacterized protein (DUF1330 family)